MLEPATSRKGSIFSRTSRATLESRPNCKRRNGQKSSNRSKKGIVTSIGFDMRPSVKRKMNAENDLSCCVREYLTYASNVNIPKNPLNTSLRSASHTTDSTCCGWTANNAATNALAARTPVVWLKKVNSNRVVATWKVRLIR